MLKKLNLIRKPRLRKMPEKTLLLMRMVSIFKLLLKPGSKLLQCKLCLNRVRPLLSKRLCLNNKSLHPHQ
jgi:hypothetical protein